MGSRAGIIKAEEEGEALWFNNDLLTLKATSEETQGAFILMEELSQRGKVTPLHIHPNVDESFFVLQGEMRVHVNGSEQTVVEHGLACAPRGVPHALLATSPTLRLLVLVTPGEEAMELFFRDAGEPARERVLPQPGPLDMEKIGAAAERHGSVVVLGPPPFAMESMAPRA